MSSSSVTSFAQFFSTRGLRFLANPLAGMMALSIALTGCLPKDVASTTTTNSVSPFGLATATTVGATKVKLTWPASTDPDTVAYNIYDTTLLFAPRIIKSVPVSAQLLEATIANLATQNYYSFRVRTVDAKGKEDNNVHDLGAVPYAGIISSAVVSSTAASLSFTTGSNADAIDIFCHTTLDPIDQVVATVTDVTKTAVVVDNLAAGIQYTCRASLRFSGFNDNNSVTTVFTPMGSAAKLVFTTQPGSAVSGATLSAQPVIMIYDINNTLVAAGPDASAAIRLTVSSASPSSGTVLGTATLNAVGGVARFTGLSVNELGNKVLTATKADTSSQTMGSAVLTKDSAQFVISADGVSADKSKIEVSTTGTPPLVADGAMFYTVTITLKDKYGNPVSGTKPQFASSITGDLITQPALVTDANGQATGTIATTTADSLRILNMSSPSGLTTDTVLAPFVAGAATKLAFLTQPASVGAGVIMTSMKVAVQDQFGNTVINGVGNDAVIKLEINNNTGNAVLGGTKNVAAIAGVATFNDITIDRTGVNQKLQASSGTYASVISNPFNVTAGTPYQISVTMAGGAAVSSGLCSGTAAPLKIQLQDSGGNPANAPAQTQVTVSGLSNAQLFTNSDCSGAAQSATVTFGAGSSVKTFYFRDLRAENITVIVRDSSSTLQQGTLAVKSTPSKISLLASANTVVAGKCSAKLTITATGDDGTAGPLGAQTSVSITGLLAAAAQVYSDALCTTPLTASNILLNVPSGSVYTYDIYIKDNKAEDLSLNVADNAGVLTPASNLQSLKVLASNILFAGPSSVVSGKCSTTPFTITLKDAAGSSVNAPSDKVLSIQGLSGSAAGSFYSNNTCTGTALRTSVTVPTGSAVLQLYFKDTAAETLTLFFRDASGQLADSNAKTIGVSPSAFKILAGSTNAKNTICAGPFTLQTLDGLNTATAAITSITANLTGQGAAGNYYSDAACTSAISSLTFNPGDSSKTFYFMGQYPEVLTLTATDAAAVLTTATYAYTIQSAPGFIGTSALPFTDASGNIATWFAKGLTNVTSRFDGPTSIRSIHMSTGINKYMYVVDSQAGRVLKYDYTNKKYIGWIGQLGGDTDWNYIAGAKVTGSTLSTPSAADCINTNYYSQTPGWCIGGTPNRTGSNTYGSFNFVGKVADDGVDQYIYVTDPNAHTVARYDATTGAFKGWIGTVGSSPTASPVPAISGLHGSCSSTTNAPTPGWCAGGTNAGPSNGYAGDASLYSPYAVVYSAGYLYVGVNFAIKKFDATTGVFIGWVGKIGTAPSGCVATPDGMTPGWCKGGTFAQVDIKSSNGGGINGTPQDLMVLDGYLYVLHSDYNGVITRYNLATGAFDKVLNPVTSDWKAARAMTNDGTYIYVADYTRIARVRKTDAAVQGWIGKVNSSPVGPGTGTTTVGCDTLSLYQNTPGWCLGGSSTFGMDEASFNRVWSIDYDGNGNIITGGRDQSYGANLQIWNSATGAFGGTLAYQSDSPSQWSNDATSRAQLESYDDKGMNQPSGIYNDGTYLYVTEYGASRVKKIEVKTGKTVGWLGAVTSSPTGGQQAGCIGGPAMSYALGWCLGASYSPEWSTGQLVPNNTDATMYHPVSVTGDGTYIYVLDRDWHRIQKFKAADGTYMGWVGRTNSVTGLNGCGTVIAGNATPSWCKGGTSQSGTGDGMLYLPSSITYAQSTLYVVDAYNNRVASFDATTGAYKGWIGRISTTPTASTCTTTTQPTTGYIISGSGWCFGGTAQSAPNDRGGAFDFNNSRIGITTNGTDRLYIANFYNSRIDRFDLNGNYKDSASTNFQAYSGTWTAVPATVAAMRSGNYYPRDLWMDGTSLYMTMDQSYGNNASPVVKMDIATGNIIGWKGYILPNYQASANGDGGTGCAGARNQMTPGWCQGGRPGYSLYLGGLYTGTGISGDANFVYITDESTHRVTRLPK